MEIRRKGKEVKPIVDTISAGVDLLDLITGGGFGRGTIVNIIGDNSTGKTLLVCETVFRSLKKYKDTLHHFNNAEAGFSFNTEAIYSYRMLPKNEDDRSTTVEEFMADFKEKMDQAKKSKKRLIYILDSMDALSSEAELKRAKQREEAIKAGKTYEVGSYRLEKQTLLNEFFRKNVNEIEKTQTILIIISQTREKIDAAIGQKWRVSCEGALKFYAKLRILLRETGKIKETIDGKPYIVGVMIRAKTYKNKIIAPYKECDFEILFDYGVDNIGSNVDFLYDLKTDTGLPRKKINISINKKTFTDRNLLIKYIEREGLEQFILQETTKKWKEIQSKLQPNRKKKS